MTRTLYLLRHAQSADKQINQPDKERELTPTGIKDSLLIGYHLLKENSPIDIILTSPATRASSTASLIADALRISQDKIIVEEELYAASVRTFLAFINGLDDSYSHILCIGHNPSISYLAEYITHAEIGDMVPAGLASIKFNIQSWKEASQGNGELMNYTYPELLADQ